MKKIIFSLILVFALVFLASCGAKGGDIMDFEPSHPGAYEDSVVDKENSVEIGSGSLADADQKIIKTVYETVETEVYDDFITALRAAVSEAGGYIASSNYNGGGIYNSATNRRASFEIRIPAEGLGGFTDAVGGIGAVTYYEESASDVTLTYVDITSRISVLEAEEAALLSILARAESTADILTIRSSLSDVQSELASLRAQKKVIDDKVAYSTVNLTLREVKRVSVAKPGFFEEIGNEFTDSLEDIGSGFRGFFVWLIGDSLYILLVCAVLFGVFLLARLAVRRIKVLRANKNAKGEKGESKGDS